MASNANVADVDQNFQTDNTKTTVHTDVNRDGQGKGKEMDEDLTDFLEFQLEDHKRSRNKGTSVQVVEHDFKKVEAKYNERKQTELQHIKNDKQKLKESEKKEASKSTISLTSSLDNPDSDLEEYDDWKLMEVEIEFNDLYDFRGRNLKEVFNADISNMPKTAEGDKDESGWTSKLGLKNNKSTGISDSNTSIPDALERHLANGSSRSITSIDSKNGKSQKYTRVAMAEQANKYLEMDKKFDFLFQNENDNLRKLRNMSHASLVDTKIGKNKVKNCSGGRNDEEKTLVTDSNIKNEKERTDIESNSDSSDAFEQEFADIENKKGDDDEMNEADEEMTLDNQLLTTKSMLNGSQKIAYAALAKLTMVEQHMKLDEIRGSGSVKIMKKLASSQKSFTRWSIKVMDDLYEHLGIDKPEERQMIENLSCHGIEPEDLAKWFDTNLVVKNSLMKSKNQSETGEQAQVVDMDEEDSQSESLNIDLRWTLIADLFLILLQSSVYDARSRVMMVNFARYIGIKNLEVYQFERRITGALEMDEITAMVNKQTTWSDKDLLKEHKKKGRGKRIVKIAFATMAGGLVIGLSAGVLAPVIGAGVAAGFSTIGIGGTAGIFAGTVGTSTITAGGVLTGMNIGKTGMEHRVGNVKTFEFKPLHNNGRLNLILTVSGWMSGTKDDIRLPFSTIDPVMGDLYSLLWEPETLTSMGQTIEILANEILTQSIQQILGATILITLMSAIQLPMWLSKLSYILDNPWNVSLDRADTSGLILADTLRRNKLGVRPVTLVGFSLGAKVIFSCLLDLARTGDYGLVESVYIFGAPIVVSTDTIVLAHSVISGRFVNGYSKQDWILGYLFRATSGGWRSIAGLSPVKGIENMDCTSLVKGHMEYRKVMPKLLRKAGWEIISDTFVEIQKPDEEASERQRKLISDFEKMRNEGKKPSKWYNRLLGKKNKQWWEMYEEGMKEQEQKEAEKVEEEQEGEKKKQDKKKVDETSDLFDVDQLRKEVAKIQAQAEAQTEAMMDNKKKGSEKSFQEDKKQRESKA